MTNDQSADFSVALVALLRGVVNRESQDKQWNTVIDQRPQLSDYVAKMGLILILDQTDGYAYLKQQTFSEDQAEIPRLIPRYQLSYPVSLMLVLLRKQLLEFDTHNSDERFILSKKDLFDKMLPYLKDASNETKQMKEMEANMNRVEEMGFIRKLKGSDSQYEILRIIRSFVDAQWLGEIDKRLKAYQAYSSGAGASIEEDVTDEPV